MSPPKRSSPQARRFWFWALPAVRRSILEGAGIEFLWVGGCNDGDAGLPRVSKGMPRRRSQSGLAHCEDQQRHTNLMHCCDSLTHIVSWLRQTASGGADRSVRISTVHVMQRNSESFFAFVLTFV